LEENKYDAEKNRKEIKVTSFVVKIEGF